MGGLYAVFRKEVASYFVSPVAYAVIAIFLCITGFFFWANLAVMSELSLKAANNPMLADRINVQSIVIRPLIANMAVILLFLTPLITMRLFSEEKKSGAIELLLTYPIHDVAVMLGKFLGASFVVVVMLAGTFTFPLLLAGLGQVDLRVMYCGYLGLLLMGLAFVSLGTFVSTLTENQIISSAITFCAAIGCWVLGWAGSVSDDRTGFVFRQMSVLEHLEPFTKGIISLSDVSFFVLFVGFFLFLTLRSLETHRWRG